MGERMKWYLAKVPELEVGAAAGDPDAMYQLAQRYRKGREVPQDLPRAVDWLLRAADLGHAHAQSSMGVRYYYGEGVPKNHRLAMKWYLAGTEKCEPEAFYNVGDLFDDSDEIPKNPVECCAWMLVAATYGYHSAFERVDPLVKMMSPENIERAARRGAEIYAQSHRRLPLDPSRSFREAKPLPQAAAPPEDAAPTRMTLVVEYVFHANTENADRLLIHQLNHGPAKLWVRGEQGTTRPPDYVPESGEPPMTFDCLEPQPDGTMGVMAFSDYDKFIAHHGQVPGLQLPCSVLSELMDKLGAATFVINHGTPAACSMHRRRPA